MDDAHGKTAGITRRALIACALGAIALRPAVTSRAQEQLSRWSYPIAFPGGVPGDGLLVKHGYACENAIYYPGLLHTGENWHGIDRNALEADILSASDGDVVYADFDYPGRVVIIQHEDELFSMYGHLDYDLAVSVGDRVERGTRIGRPVPFPGDIERSHLHFEIRTFFLTNIVNGTNPSHGFTCGFQCPPGPGYWPINAAQHPSDLGWLNPTHLIEGRRYRGSPPDDSVVVVTSTARATTPLWTLPSDRANAEISGSLDLFPGERFSLTGIATGLESTYTYNAEGYRLWYRIETPESGEAWVQAAFPAEDDVGLDGLPSSVRFDLLPVLS
jgi:hypothetical protein